MKDTFKHIRQLLSNVDLRFTKATLVSGAEIEYEGEELEVGMEVDVITETGERVDAPDGEHETLEGVKFVTEGGVVISFVESTEEPVDEIAEELEADEDEKDKYSELEERVNSLETRIAEAMERLEQFTTKFTAYEEEVTDKNEQFAKLSESFTKISTKVEEIANTPLPKQIEEVVVSNQFNKTKSRASKILSSK